eukprot:GHVP01071166.1.p1 GENE.GHVP01071166.1~~GHVP01071166.1.p1  ORF type:complete len:120 (-),score=2.91 GHVP01071166.1:251-610(-)
MPDGSVPTPQKSQVMPQTILRMKCCGLVSSLMLIAAPSSDAPCDYSGFGFMFGRALVIGTTLLSVEQEDFFTLDLLAGSELKTNFAVEESAPTGTFTIEERSKTRQFQNIHQRCPRATK